MSYSYLCVRLDSRRKKLMQSLVHSWETSTYYSYHDPTDRKKLMYYARVGHYDAALGSTEAAAKAATFRGQGFNSVKVITVNLGTP